MIVVEALPILRGTILGPFDLSVPFIPGSIAQVHQTVEK
jgi:hypothetical protein